MGRLKGKKNLVRAEQADTLSSRFGKWCKAKEMRLAEYLNQKTAGLSFRSWLILLAGFCLLTGGYLIYLLIGIFN